MKNLGLGGNIVISQISRVKFEKKKCHFMQSQGLRISPNGQLEFPKILKQSLYIGNQNSRLKILKNKISLIEKYPWTGLECKRL